MVHGNIFYVSNIYLMFLDLNDFDYIFSENGLLAIKNGQEIAKQVCICINLIYLL